MININELYQKYADNPIKWMEENNCITTKDITTLLMKEAIKQAIPIVLKEVSEKASLNHLFFDRDDDYENYEEYKDQGFLRTDRDGIPYAVDVIELNKESITSLSEELIQKLLKNE